MERILIRLYPNALSMAALGSGAKRLNIALAADLAEINGQSRQAEKKTADDEPEYAADLRAGFQATIVGTALDDTVHLDGADTQPGPARTLSSAPRDGDLTSRNGPDTRASDATAQKVTAQDEGASAATAPDDAAVQGLSASGDEATRGGTASGSPADGSAPLAADADTTTDTTATDAPDPGAIKDPGAVKDQNVRR